MNTLNKLKGAAQMVANMLERDKLPARIEAAAELKELVALLERHVSQQSQELAKRAVRIFDLTKHLEAVTSHLENDIVAADNIGTDSRKRKDVKAARAYLKSRSVNSSNPTN